MLPTPEDLQVVTTLLILLSSWASSTGGGGGRVRQMFVDRNRPGVDKSVPLDPIEDTNKKPLQKNQGKQD